MKLHQNTVKSIRRTPFDVNNKMYKKHFLHFADKPSILTLQSSQLDGELHFIMIF